MRTRLIIAFIVVALLSALASSWFHTLIGPYHLPAWLDDVILGPRWLQSLVHTAPGQPAPHPVRHVALVFFGVEAGLLLAMITAVAIAASRRVLLPVQRLAQAATRMSGGDLAVRIAPRGRDELAQLVGTFNDMAASLEGKVAELRQMEARARQFAGDVSHELRTPLTAMTAVTDILYEHPGLSGNAATAARLVHHEVIHLNRLVQDLIEISRFDAGTATLVTDDADVATAIGRCLRTRGWSQVSTEVPAGLTAVLDRRRFDVILANLVGNALRHGAPPVTVTGVTEPDGHGGQRLAVAVRDHGTGLPGTEIPHLFDRFYKADTARARSEGSGLGLAIAQENARLHGGHIDVANHPGGGAIFTITLPLNERTSASATQQPQAEHAQL
jgi:two-component system, OmpR family, sensor histidine kinase MtrB